MPLIHLNEPLKITMYHVLPEDVSDFIAVYFLHHDESSCTVIDTGPQVSVERLFNLIKRKLNCRLEKALLTHIHLDHGGGAGGLIEAIPDTEVYVHPRGSRHLENPERLWEASLQALGPVAEFYSKPKPVPQSNIVVPRDGDMISLGDVSVEVIYTPGHASHHMSFWIPSEKVLFSGDSAGMYLEKQGKFVPSTPPPFYYKQYLESLDRQARLSPNYIAFPHNTIIEAGDYLKRHKEQIISWVESSLDALQRLGDTGDTNKALEAVKRAVSSADDQARELLNSEDQLIRSIMISSLQGLIDYILRIRPREEG